MEQIHLTKKSVTYFYLILSLSLFSVLCTYFYYYYYYSFLLNSVNLASRVELLLTHSIDKTYVFLICNGIFVVLFKTSGSLISQSRFDLKEHMYIKSIQEALQTEYEYDAVEDVGLVIRVDRNIEEDMEKVEESNEELTKKFDEFIRKRKEELMNDAQLLSPTTLRHATTTEEYEYVYQKHQEKWLRHFQDSVVPCKELFKTRICYSSKKHC